MDGCEDDYLRCDTILAAAARSGRKKEGVIEAMKFMSTVKTFSLPW